MKRTWVLVIVGMLYFGVGWLLSAIGPSLPELASRAGRLVTELGAIFTMFSLGGVLASIGVGAAIERWGMRTVIGAGAVLMGCGMLIVGLVPALGGLLLGAGIAGFGYSGMLAGGNLLIARLFNGAAGAINALNLFFSVGSISGPLLVAAMIALFAQPQVALWLGGLFMLALVWPALRLRDPAPVATTQMAGAPSWLAAVTSGLLMFSYIGTEVGIAGWITLMLERGAGLAPPLAALGSSLFWGMSTVSRLGAALIGDRVGAVPMLSLSLSGLAVGGGLLIVGIAQASVALLAVALIGLSCGPIFPTNMLLITRAAGRSGAALSVALTIGTGGGLFLPALFGLLIGWFGPASGAWLVVIDAGFMLVLLLIARYDLNRSTIVVNISPV